MRNHLIIGTRRSPLALWQSEYVKATLQNHYPGLVVELKHIVTMGDKTQDSKAAIPTIGGKGLFTAELEEALVAKEIDLAVHSLKDLPTELAAEFIVGAIPVRSHVEDAFISRRGNTLLQLPAGAVVGTSSVRRSSQILRVRPDLKIAHIRGNVDTRLRKLRAEGGEYDAIVLAHAGLSRLNLSGEITEVLSLDAMLPAPGQGALGIECRAEDAEVVTMLSVLHHAPTAVAVNAERAFLKGLGAGCNTPVAAFGLIEQRDEAELVVLKGRCLASDGSRLIEVSGSAVIGEEVSLGERLAREAFAQGFLGLCSAQ